MALRRRSRVKRQMTVLAAFLALLGLLELNRWLPGGWPGGGGEGGFRSRPHEEAATRRLRPPDTTPSAWPREGVTVTLLAAGGTIPDDATLAADVEGAAKSPVDARGHARLADARVLTHGFVVRTPSVEVRHGAADPTSGEPWIVHLPDGGRGRVEAGDDLTLEVLGAEDGEALGDAAVAIDGPDAPETLHVDAAGRLTLPPLSGRSRVTVTAPGRRPGRVWVHPRQTESRVRVRLWRALPTDLRFLDAEDGTAVGGIELRIRAPTGEVLWAHETGFGETTRAEPPSDLDLEDAVLEVWSPSHPVVQVPLPDLEDVVRLPRGRLLEVEARDAGSRRLSDLRLSARYEPVVLGKRSGGDASEALEVHVRDRGRLVLPLDRDVRVLVEASHSTPQVLEEKAGTEVDAKPRVVRLQPGAILTVRAVDAEGVPVVGARVVAVASVDGMTVERDGRTTAGGTVRINALPPSPVEVYAHARGKAWAATVADLATSKEPVVLTLVEGRALRFVVEDGDGLPLGGVRVHARPEWPSEAADVVPPDARPTRTGADGTLVIPELPDRPYEIRFSRPGYVTVVRREVRPGGGVHFVTLRRRR